VTTERIADHVKFAYWAHLRSVAGRYEASYGAEYQHESTSFSLALLLATQRLKVIAAVHPGLSQPAVLAKLGATLREIIEMANRHAVEGFRSAVQQAGNSTSDKRGVWAESTFEDLVQYNDGFRTQLIGTPEQIAERVAAYRKRGVDLILGGFLHFQEEIEYFGSRVLPLVREIEDSEEDSVGEPVPASA
jgi:alkanesulfonate monooxygenase SsuD/methylene tetrahydromethanopterin reductase-like flavin-dependent oxidoreductase (luciferase family)